MKLDTPQKKIMALLGGIALLAAFLIFGTDQILRRITPSENTSGNSLPELAEPMPEQEDADTTKVNFTDEVITDTRPVLYTDVGFSPLSLTINASDSMGCLITVLNRSSAPIRVGVSPHDPAGDPGANYGEIPAGGSVILDPRYTGLTSVDLHNHYRPEHEFHVLYGPGCQ